MGFGVSEFGQDTHAVEEAFKLIRAGQFHEQESHRHIQKVTECYNAALERLSLAFSQSIIRFCDDIVGEDMGEDMAESALLAAREGMSTFRGEHGIHSLKNWLYTIAKHFCIKELDRRKQEHQRYESVEVTDVSESCFKQSRRSKWYERWEDVSENTLGEAIEALKNDDDKIILKMDMHPDITIRDIADILGINEAAVRQRIHRASRRLAAILGL